MMRIFIWVRLAFVAAMSSLLVQAAWAHEVTPGIANFQLFEDELQIEFRINAEALLAGINLDGLDDTNNAPGVGEYDALRALQGQALEQMIEARFDHMIGRVQVTLNGQPAALSMQRVDVQMVQTIELARAATILAAVPATRADTLDLTWPVGYGTLILRQNGVEAPYTGTLQGGDSSGPVPLSGGETLSATQAFVQYIPVGFDHILPKGLDHILFVLGLFFLSTRLRPLIWQISAFTLAHTVTLAAGALGWVSVPGSIVEPLIAASICFVAIENILAKGLTPWRPVIVFLFGLLHGLGFASVLGEFGLPDSQFIPALLGFNVGVELGQLTVIAIAFLAVGAWFGRKPWYRRMISIPGSLVIAVIGAYWVIERVFL
jgi:hypothetical protein